jgi:hypothetical protein
LTEADIAFFTPDQLFTLEATNVTSSSVNDSALGRLTP